MTRYLTKADAQAIIDAALPPYVTVRDVGQLHAALLRPQTTASGDDAYPDPWQKATALMQSILIGRPLTDGNKRLAWISAKLFLRLNGQRVGRPDQDDAYDLVITVTTGDLVDVPETAEQLGKLMPTAE